MISVLIGVLIKSAGARGLLDHPIGGREHGDRVGGGVILGQSGQRALRRRIDAALSFARAIPLRARATRYAVNGAWPAVTRIDMLAAYHDFLEACGSWCSLSRPGSGQGRHLGQGYR